MDRLLDFIRAEVHILIIGMAAAVLYRLLGIGARAKGLLSDPDGRLSVSCIQLLVVATAGALYVLTHTASRADELTVPAAYLYLLAGSSLIQVAGQTRISRHVRRLISPTPRIKE